jgi:hypothetical protein
VKSTAFWWEAVDDLRILQEILDYLPLLVTAQPLTTPTGEKEALREILREYPGYSRIVYVPLR